MKKSLVALAVLAAAGAASAQSSVTLWGIVDANVERLSQNGVSKTQMSTSGLSSSQLGFRGTEDLGGGMTAGFWLEAGVANDTGGTGLAFNRRSTLDLSTGAVAVRLGRDYTPSFWNHTVFDPFGTLGAGAGSNITLGGLNGAANANVGTAARTNNGISLLYGFAPNAGSSIGSGGVYVQATYALAENVSGTAANGKYLGARVGFVQGPLNAAVSYAASTNTPYAWAGNGATAPVAGAGSLDYKELNIAGSYDLGVAKLMAHIGTNNNNAVGDNKFTHFGIGAQVPVGAGYIPVSYNQGKLNNAAKTGANQFAVGYVYNLSKRTAVYTTLARISNKNNGNFTFQGGNGGGSATGLSAGAAGANGTGFDFGVKHSF